MNLIRNAHDKTFLVADEPQTLQGSAPQSGKTFWSRRLQILILLLFLAFVAGCVSPDRLLNLTPLSNGDSQRTVNLWPLYYGNTDGVSVLWPIFDSNEKGFALRPLVFKEGKEWGILWPVSDFDEQYFRLLNVVISKAYGFGVVPLLWIDHEESNDGFYQFLLGYKRGENWGVFPFFHNGEGYSYCFPLYYHNCNTKKLLTPISYFSPTFNYFTLAWWNRDNGHFGFYPLFHVGREGYRFLLWWKSPNSTGLFPIYISSKDFTAAGPVWWNKNAWGVFPVCRFGEKSSYCLNWWKTQNSTGLFPIYWNVKDFTAVGPVWWDRDSRGVFPFFSYRATEGERRVGILFHLIGGYEEQGPYNSSANGQSHALPHNCYYSYDWLYYFGKIESSRNEQRGLKHHFRMWPVFGYTSTSQLYPPKKAEGTLEHYAALGTLWNYSSSSHNNWAGEKADDCRALFNLIKSGHLALDKKQSSSPNHLYDMQETNILQSINAKCKLLGLDQIEQLTHASLESLADDFERKYTRSLVKDRKFGMLLNLVGYRHLHDDSTSFKLLWGALLNHKSSQDISENTILWRGFRQVTTPTTTSREIFPFISYYNSKEDDTTTFAFAWRLFRHESSPNGSKLWLFFIPF